MEGVDRMTDWTLDDLRELARITILALIIFFGA
jgi:hypothetical protein